MKRILYVIIIAILAVSCERHSENWATIVDVENYIEERPDSALAVLRSIDSSELSGGEESARYALLLSIALDKNYIDLTNDSIIQIAREYYINSEDIRRKFQSLYYSGRVYVNAKDYKQAMIEYSEAESLLPELNDNYLAGLLYMQFGEIYSLSYDYKKWIDASEKAYQYYSLANKEPHKSYALLEIGMGYWNAEENDKAEVYILKALNAAKTLKDEYLERMCYENLIIYYDGSRHKEKNEKLVSPCINTFNPKIYSSVTLGALSGYYTNIREYEKADSFMAIAWNNAKNVTDTIALYFKSANIMKRRGDKEKALAYFEKGIKYQGEELGKALQRPVLTAQKEYYQERAEYHSLQLKMNRRIYAISAIAVALLAVIIIMYYRHRFKLKDLEINRYIDLADELKSTIQHKDSKLTEISAQISEKEGSLNSMSEQLAELFKHQYDLLDKLSKTYYETNGNKRVKDIFYDQVKNEINKLSNEKASVSQLEKIVNTYKHNVISIIRNEIPNITERDVTLLCYVYAGFSSKSISVFVGETINNVLTRKSRLRAKIANSESPNKELILKEMP